MARAKEVWDNLMGFRNSSSKISPGEGLSSKSVVIDDFDFVRMSISPNEANPPLVVDADRMLTFPACFKSLQSISRWYPKVGYFPGIVEKTQLTQCSGLDV